MIDRAVTLLPQPDSPTSPTVSPASSSNETPRTARTSASSDGERRLELVDGEQRVTPSAALGRGSERRMRP